MSECAGASLHVQMQGGQFSHCTRAYRSMRAFRVIRLFGKLGSLRDIIAALTAAIIPVMSSI